MKGIRITSNTIMDVIDWFNPISTSNITLFPFVISREPISDADMEHEQIHIEQQFEVSSLASVLGLLTLFLPQENHTALAIWLLFCWLPLVGPYYLIYLAMYLSILVKFHGKIHDPGVIAYHRHPFEQEAYDYAGLPRRWFGWLKYLSL